MIDELKALKRLRGGDEAAFETLFNMYKERLYLFAIKFVKSDELACDIIHDVFAKVWEIRAQIDYQSNFSSFLHSICKDLIFNLLKKASRQETLKLKIIRCRSRNQNTPEEEKYFKEKEKAENVTVKLISNNKPEKILKLGEKVDKKTVQIIGTN